LAAVGKASNEHLWGQVLVARCGIHGKFVGSLLTFAEQRRALARVFPDRLSGALGWVFDRLGSVDFLKFNTIFIVCFVVLICDRVDFIHNILWNDGRREIEDAIRSPSCSTTTALISIFISILVFVNDFKVENTALQVSCVLQQARVPPLRPREKHRLVKNQILISFLQDYVRGRINDMLIDYDALGLATKIARGKLHSI